jgi:hypothetical protein
VASWPMARSAERLNMGIIVIKEYQMGDVIDVVTYISIRLNTKMVILLL